MKSTKLIFSAILFLLSQFTFAQTGQWKLAGNSLTGTQKLGSTNNFNLNFITNNTTRMTLNTVGNLGIGTAAPDANLHVFRGSAGTVSGFFNAPVVVENSTDNYINLLSPGAKESGILFGNPISNVDGGIIYNNFANLGGLQFRTSSNFTRMVLTNTGNLGIGTISPKANLHVFRGSAGVTPFFNAPVVVENSTDNYINLLSPSANESGILFGNPISNVDGGIIYNNFANLGGLQFRTSSNFTRMVLTNTGNLGIGTISPKANLHVFRGSAGVTPFFNAPLVVENSTDNYINLLAPNAKETGILFGKTENSISGGLIYNNTSNTNGFQFRTNGNFTRMVLTSAGFVGIGTTAPKSELQVVHGDGFGTHGLRLQHTSGKFWNLYTASTGNLQLYIGPDPIALVGEFSSVNGEYIRISDARMKKDIEIVPDVLSKVLQLDVKKYHFLRSRPEDNKSYGMIAQEVEKIFPEVVYHNKMDGSGKDYYMMDYSAFGVLAIKAIQEQQKKIEEQQQTIQAEQQTNRDQQNVIEKLQSDMEDLKKRIGIPAVTTNQSSNISKETHGLPVAHLNQNAPNPFSTTTVISYYLPETNQNASIEVISSNGQPVKTFPLTQKGNGQLYIKAAELSAGTYFYTLKINGVKTDSKQMILVK